MKSIKQYNLGHCSDPTVCGGPQETQSNTRYRQLSEWYTQWDTETAETKRQEEKHPSTSNYE